MSGSSFLVMMMTEIFKKSPVNSHLGTYVTSWLTLLLPALALTTKHGISLMEIAFIVAGIVYAKPLWQHAKDIYKHCYFIPIAFVVNFVVILLSLLITGGSLAELDKSFLQILSLPALALIALHKPQQKWLWYGLFFGTLGALFFAIYQRFGLGLARAHGFKQIIMFGDIAIAMALMSLAGLIRYSETKLAPLLYISFFAGLGASILSGTRGGWLALFLSFIPLYIYSSQKLRQKITIILLLGVGVFIVSVFIPELGVGARIADVKNDWQRYQAGDPATSVGARLEMWQSAVRMFVQHPFLGVGHSNSHQELQAYSQAGLVHQSISSFGHAHNEFLHALATKGLLGGIALMLLYGAPLAFFVKILRKRDDNNQAYALAGVLLVTGYIDFGLTQSLFAHHVGTAFYALCVNVLVGLCLSTPDEALRPLALQQRFAKLVPYFGKPRSAWFVVFFATALAAATEPLIPAALKLLLDRGFQKGRIDIWMVPVTIIGIFAIRGIAGYIAEITVTKITAKGLMCLRRDMFDKLLNAKFKLFSDQSASELANSVVYEVNSGASLLVGAIVSLTRNIVTLVALILYLLYLNWQLTLIVAIMLPAVALIMTKLSKKLYGITKSTQSSTDGLAYVVEENVLAHRDIRLHTAQSAQSIRFASISETLRKLSIRSSKTSAAMKPLTQMLAAVALSAVISVALMQSAGGEISVGAFTAFVTAMLLLVAPIKQLSEITNPITRGLAALERGFALLDQTENEKSGTFSNARAEGKIEFNNVMVSYNSDTGLAVDHFNLSISSGETIALVGASGSGKTTLVNLLPRFIEPTSGSISLDDHDLRDWDLGALRHQFAFVSQHVVMLNDSIANNVALGQTETINRQRITECLQAARLGEWIENLPQGIDTNVGHNAVQLSGGQRQRLAIARALYKDAPILILDEATSALDAESERAVQEALQTLMQGRTTLVIAHRLSTVEHANRIIMMGAGKILEIGSHTDLLALDGAYAKLYRLGLHSA